MKDAEKVGKKSIIIICILVITLLLSVTVGVYFYNNPIKIDDSELTSTNESVINFTNPYEKHGSLKWYFKDTDNEYTVLKSDSCKIEIKNSKIYISKNNKEILATSVTDNPKYVIRYGKNTVEGAYIITEKGTVWQGALKDGVFFNNFVKLSIDGFVIDVTDGEKGVKSDSGPYFLLSSGKLINASGIAYEEVTSSVS